MHGIFQLVCTDVRECTLPTSGQVEHTPYHDVSMESKDGACLQIGSGKGMTSVVFEFSRTGDCTTGCPGCLKSAMLGLVNPNGDMASTSDCLYEHPGSDCNLVESVVNFQIDISMVGTWSIEFLQGWDSCSGLGLINSKGVIAQIHVQEDAGYSQEELAPAESGPTEASPAFPQVSEGTRCENYRINGQ